MVQNVLHSKPSYFFAAQFFLRCLGLIYFIAFLSLWGQVQGLFGHDGISPIAQYLPLLFQHSGTSSYWIHPSLFWLSSGDWALSGACALGCLCAALLALGFLPALSAFCLWLLYLSFLNADFAFLQFQWDNLLVEAGFLAIFLAPNRLLLRLDRSAEPHPDILFLFRLLLFRLMFSSGVVKLSSGDPHWRDFSALKYHFLTQPLPNIAAYYAAKIPERTLQGMSIAVFAVELFVPFFFFARRSLRHTAAALTIGFQMLIFLTGNYTFFNLLTAALCLLLLEDSFFRKFFRFSDPTETDTTGRTSHALPFICIPLVPLLLLSNAVTLGSLFTGYSALPVAVRQALGSIQPFRLVNPYGLFAVMTTERHEIIIEGSDDGENWRPYASRWKPDDLYTAPKQIAPFQPRLDWQLWFAALSSPDREAWFMNVLVRLHQGSQPVVRLFANNPFPAAPPKFLRALLYDYQFSSIAEKKQNGAWWKRRLLGFYLRPVEFDESEEGNGDATDAELTTE
jgi:hypothetical protein